MPVRAATKRSRPVRKSERIKGSADGVRLLPQSRSASGRARGQRAEPTFQFRAMFCAEGNLRVIKIDPKIADELRALGGAQSL